AGGSPALVGAPPELDRGRRDAASGVLATALGMGATSELECVVVLPAADLRVVVVGLGDADVTPERVRRAVGAALRKVSALPNVSGLTVGVSMELADPELVRAAGEGALLGC